MNSLMVWAMDGVDTQFFLLVSLGLARLTIAEARRSIALDDYGMADAVP